MLSLNFRRKKLGLIISYEHVISSFFWCVTCDLF
ncbi:unnamed protein product [Arabidopsis halleri]